MGLLNPDRRRITKRDLHTKARILAEGVQVEVIGTTSKNQQGLAHRGPMEVPVEGNGLRSLLQDRAQTDHHNDIHEAFGEIFILEPSGIPTPIRRDARSPLLLQIDGSRGRLLENSSEITRGSLFSSLRDLPWCGQRIDGIPIESILYLSSPGIINMEFTLSCYNHNTGMPCLYCGIYASPALEKFHSFSLDSLREYAALQAKALKAATETGWRGNIAISGGALAPEVRKEYLKRTEIVVDAIHRTLDSKVVDELTLIYCHYPPEDFSDFKRLKDMGIQVTDMDLEVFNDEAFRRICPGKHAYKPLSYWRQAQEAAVEVFGPYWNTVTTVVVGLEPIERLVEGVEERLSKGVLVLPLQFYPAPGSAMENARPRDARWIMEATEKLVDCYAPYAPVLLKAVARASLDRLLSSVNPWAAEKAVKNSLGVVKGLRLYQHATAFDEMLRRIMKVPGGRLLPLPTAV